MEGILVSVFGHIIEDEYPFKLKEEEVIVYKDNTKEVKSFIWNYWKKKNDMRGVVDIIKKVNLSFGSSKVLKYISKAKSKNIGVQTTLDLFS